MPHSCVQHPSVRASAACGQCGHLFCGDCLVYPFGEQRPPMCVGCALSAAGVRRKKTNRPKLRRSVIRSRLHDQAIEAVTPTAPPEPEVEEAEPVMTAEEQWLLDASEDMPGAWRQVF